jgi:hypothetical protein
LACSAPEYPDATAVRANDIHNQSNRGRLARSIRAQKPVDAARRDPRRKAVNRPDTSERFANLLKQYRVHTNTLFLFSTAGPLKKDRGAGRNNT